MNVFNAYQAYLKAQQSKIHQQRMEALKPIVKAALERRKEARS